MMKSNHHSGKHRPHLPPAVSIMYSGWRLTRLAESATHSTYAAFKTDDLEHTYPAVTLLGAENVFCEGYWPFRPTYAPKIVLGGACLYTAAWAVHFAAAKHGSIPRPLSLGLPGDLTRALEMLKKGRSISGFQLPTRPGLYHQRLITWQAAVLQRFPTVETVRYTLPIPDYHGYILHLENALGYALPGLHSTLDQYAQTIQEYMRQVWGETMRKVQFDIPGSIAQKQANLLSRENDFQLYLAAVRDEEVMGMEDLPEVALPHEVARRTGIIIPCAVAVLDLPDPYMVRTDASYACKMVSLEAMR
jgi:hypothetical protein